MVSSRVVLIQIPVSVNAADTAKNAVISIGEYASLSTTIILATTTVKSYKDGRRKLTELAKCLHLAIFYSGKSKEMCEELVFMLLHRTGAPTGLGLGIEISIRKKKMVLERL